MTKKAIIIGAPIRLAKRWTVVSLLLLYALGSSNFQFFHSLLHEHLATELHTDQNEADPCHITLYHQDRDGGCDHDSHIVKHESCSLCHAQVPPAQIVEASLVPLPRTCSLHYFNLIAVYTEGIDFQPSGRAPPTSVR